MSDHDPAPDPMDKAYAQAEAVLSDDSARAARRARVLAAVAREAAAPAVSSPAIQRSTWRRGGWLVAASVAGLSVFVATQIDRPTPIEQPPALTTPAVPPATPPEQAALPTPTVRPPAETPKAGTRPPAVRAGDATSRSRDLSTVSPSPPPLEVARAPGPPPAATPAAADGVSEGVVTGSRTASAPAGVELQSAPAQVEELVLSSPATLGARLHAAAAAGRTADVAALLAKGVLVDAPDDDGETALMKSIQADQPATAALLRRHGASLDRKNHAGVSARDMATSIDDPKLNRALGLGR